MTSQEELKLLPKTTNEVSQWLDTYQECVLDHHGATCFNLKTLTLGSVDSTKTMITLWPLGQPVVLDMKPSDLLDPERLQFILAIEECQSTIHRKITHQLSFNFTTRYWDSSC